jgi:cystathionine beta-lyase
MSNSHKDSPGLSLDTRLTRTGKAPSYAGGAPVNTPLVRASTVLFDSVAATHARGATTNASSATAHAAHRPPSRSKTQ